MLTLCHKVGKQAQVVGADESDIFVARNNMTIGALKALREVGYCVPEDVTVVGFDDMPIAARTNPPLTTVRQPNQLWFPFTPEPFRIKGGGLS